MSLAGGSGGGEDKPWQVQPPTGSGHGAEGLSSTQRRGMLGWEPPKPHESPGEALPALKCLSQCPADATFLEHAG